MARRVAKGRKNVKSAGYKTQAKVSATEKAHEHVAAKDKGMKMGMKMSMKKGC